MRGFLLVTSVVVGTTNASAQVAFALDTTFRTVFPYQNVNDVLVLDDGNLILSGRIRVPEDPFLSTRSTVKVLLTGQRDLTFPGAPYSGGGGKLTRWNNKIYVGAGQTVHRLLGTGLSDPTFISPDLDPTFGSLQGGDYHVYPDGRVLLTGFHQLLDSNGNWIMHSLIWFTDSGWVDYGQTHRRSNAPIWQIEEEPDGQFLCFYSGTEYEGQATNGRIFRIHADGSLDTTLESRVGSGTIFSLLPLPDGRFYASGFFNKVGTSGTIRLARFLPNGDLDPTFNNAIDFQRGDIPGNDGAPTVSPIQPWRNGAILVLGVFQTVNGQPRGGMCVVDSTGALLDHFDNCSVGGYVYEDFHYQGTTGYLETTDGMAYIWGAYHGYNDGTTNDTLQRFVSRLYGPDWPAMVQEQASTMAFTVYPNPAQGQVAVKLQRPNTSTRLVLRDATGRIVLEQRGHTYETRLEVGKLTTGCYLVEVYEHDERIGSEKLILQP